MSIPDSKIPIGVLEFHKYFESTYRIHSETTKQYPISRFRKPQGIFRELESVIQYYNFNKLFLSYLFQKCFY